VWPRPSANAEAVQFLHLLQHGERLLTRVIKVLHFGLGSEAHVSAVLIATWGGRRRKHFEPLSSNLHTGLLNRLLLEAKSILVNVLHNLSHSREYSMETSLKLIPTPEAGTVLRLVLLGDTHELHREVEVPDGDILIHVGDFTMFSKNMRAVADFNTWLGELPHHRKILVPGNHEYFLEAHPSNRSMLHNATVLINESIEAAGLRIWGSPVTPLYGGAFGLSSAEDRKRLYAQIPHGTDVLITHGPPYGILDSAPGSGIHSGCRELLEAVLRIGPKLHIFGHIHGAYGILRTDQTTFVNVAAFGNDGDLEMSPLVLLMPHL
jgi:Icc-related predicted phosphoesterase